MAETIEFARWKNVPEVAAAAAEVEDKFVAYVSGLAGHIESIRLSMADTYWDLLIELLRAQTEPFPKALSFDEQERMFIDFGYMGDRITPLNPNFDMAQVLHSKTELGVFPFMTFSDFIAEGWAVITGQEPPVPVCGASTDMRMRAMERRLRTLLDDRDETLMKLAETVHEKDIVPVLEVLNECLSSAMKVEHRMREFREADDSLRRYLLRERTRYVEAERKMRDILVSASLPRYAFDEFYALHESGKIAAIKLIYLRQEEEKTERRVKRTTNTSVQLSQDMMRKEFELYVLSKRDSIYAPTKLASYERSLLTPRDSAPATYAEMSQAVNRLCEPDMEMFAVAKVRMYGVPRVVFVPGQGLGSYDPAEHAVMIPVFPVTSIEKAVLYGMASFRWFGDDDRVVRGPYELLKENRGKSEEVIAASFRRDYFNWIAKEESGYKVLNSTVRRTFERVLARGED
ncbi:MAG: hypothetical protein LBR38_04270 [Synergistaceae bacterium]|nr:hypothetical protein [Synergistaceae bacterium]